MAELKIGTEYTIKAQVTEPMTARQMGSGQAEVLATPSLLALMEQAAWTAAAPALEAGCSTVGTLMNVKHLSPTPLGMRVTCRAELTEVDGRRLVFRVTAWDAAGPVGEGIHERAVIQNDRFLEKAAKKAAAL